jgi:hypothetical protein
MHLKTPVDNRRGSRLRLARLLFCLLLAGCASTPEAPYPVFIRTAELPDTFLAGLPGVRAKHLAGNPDTRRSSDLVTLPPDWSFTTGGFPDKSVEIYVVAGSVKIGEFLLEPGGYAFIPGGSTGFELSSEGGARLLYFLDDEDTGGVIQTPLVTNQNLLTWATSGGVDGFGLAEKVLREDPGSGARTWLLRVDPGALLPWRQASVPEEGFLLEGAYLHSECVAGVVLTGSYEPGGYFYRPAQAVNGGPESGAAGQTAVWYMRRLTSGEYANVGACVETASP